ncbi:MAG TPA: CoA transferase, partial [Dehalococcoidia bacterium]|nr:CoA transferase [Dehalococcoidia bacterium]
MSNVPLPLEGIRVLAPEQVIAGPYGSMILASFGADVIRVERPPTGDMYRTNLPYIENERGRTGYGLLAHNLNKRSIVLDLQREEARQIFRDLAKKVDVLWENNRPGVMDRLGLGYQDIRAINPRIVYVSVSGFGQTWASDSPYADWPAFDIVAQAMAGLMMRAGSEGAPPIYSGYPLGDLFPSVIATLGCLIALRGRDLTGQGQHVDISMYDAMTSLLTTVFSAYTFDKSLATRGGMGTSFPYGSFACRDGYFVLAVAGDVMWQRLCKLLDRPDLFADESLKTGTGRAARAPFLRGIVEDWAREKTRLEVV